MNLKFNLRLVLYFSLVFHCTFIRAQAYDPMPVSEARWDITRCWSFYPGGWHDEYSVRLDGSDTILNGHVYSKLVLITHHAPGTPFDSIYTHFLGGMRESNKQVFLFSEYLCLDTIERMLYDFNPTNPGDTIFTQVLTNGLTQFIPHIVTSVDSVWVGDHYHRSINLTDENHFFTESWIEGVGSTLGLIYPSYWLLTDNSYDLNCFYEDSELQFTNPAPAYAFCSAPLPDIQCDPLSATETIPGSEDYFQIYPNPAFDRLFIETEKPFKSLMIKSTSGQVILATETTRQLDVKNLSPGTYLIQLVSEGGQILGSRIMLKL